MPQVYINESFVDSKDANVSIFDTSVCFGDAIYEVIAFYGNKIFNLDHHLERFAVSAEKAFIQVPSENILREITIKLIEKNKDIGNGLVYLQLSRGMQKSRFDFPSINEHGNLFGYVFANGSKPETCLSVELNVKLIQDPRRYRRDVKMISLMPVKIAKIENRLYNYLVFEDRETGAITEGENSNLFIVKDGIVKTHPLGPEILPGCTRRWVIQKLENKGIEYRAVRFNSKELYSADEIFITKSSAPLHLIEKLNGEQVGGDRTISSMLISEYIKDLKDTKPTV